MIKQIFIILPLLVTQNNDIEYSFLLKCISNNEITNAEYLTDKNFTYSKGDGWNTFLKGDEKDQISYNEYFLADKSYDYITIVFFENRILNYNNLVNSIKTKAVKKNFFYSDWHNVYVYKYSLNGVNFYYYPLSVVDRVFYHVYVSKLELEKGLFKGWWAEDYKEFYRDIK